MRATPLEATACRCRAASSRSFRGPSSPSLRSSRCAAYCRSCATSCAAAKGQRPRGGQRARPCGSWWPKSSSLPRRGIRRGAWSAAWPSWAPSSAPKRRSSRAPGLRRRRQGLQRGLQRRRPPRRRGPRRGQRRRPRRASGARARAGSRCSRQRTASRPRTAQPPRSQQRAGFPRQAIGEANVVCQLSHVVLTSFLRVGKSISTLAGQPHQATPSLGYRLAAQPLPVK